MGKSRILKWLGALLPACRARLIRLFKVILRQSVIHGRSSDDGRQKVDSDFSVIDTTGTTDVRPKAAVKAALLWQHPSPADTHMWQFMQQVNQKHRTYFETYAQLHDWGRENLSSLWAEIWDYCKIRHSVPYEQVVSNAQSMWPRPRWFTNARLNFAENLLFPLTQGVGEDHLAVIAVTETDRERVTWKELRERVRLCQAGMRSMNVQVGDRVAGFVANHTNALVAMLAATSLGAIWTAVSPDTGVTATVDRLLQISPSLLFADNALLYKGKVHIALSNVYRISAALPSLKATVMFSTLKSEATEIDTPGMVAGIRVIPYQEFTRGMAGAPDLAFTQLPAEHPVYILYSSGTTGVPKCIVHGAIGTLLQHKKEHILHSDIRPGDRFCQITTCMWMMWHWLVSGLGSGATVVLYNGSPFHYYRPTSISPTSEGDEGMPESFEDYLAMPKLIGELGITQFGTSAKYLSMLEQYGVMPRACGVPLDTLQAIYSTGSPLAASTFHYVYEAFGPVHLGSISGGTDIISDFGTPCPLQPVHAGELQVVGLGLSVQAWDEHGDDVSASGKPGELVCVQPFPSQPIQFWGPEGEKKYRASYFERFAGNPVWAHGDLIQFNPQTGGMIILGRSDGVLNPCGVRFGSAEIYSLLQAYFADAIEDSLCVGKRREYDTDEVVVLFVKMREGRTFSSRLAGDIRDVVRRELSPRHIPGVIDECPGIPITPNGKKVEVLIKQIVSGGKIQEAYSRSVTNPESLDWYRAWASTYEEDKDALGI